MGLHNASRLPSPTLLILWTICVSMAAVPSPVGSATLTTPPNGPDPGLPPRGVVVLGMHRSGTSAITLLLEDLGAWGSAMPRLAAQFDNPRGFGELSRVVRVNDELLASTGRCGVGTCWYDAVRGPPGAGYSFNFDADGHAGIADRLASTVADLRGLNHGAASYWVLKDPRLCLTVGTLLPHLYDPAQEGAPVALLVYRHPVSVAKSVVKRQMPPSMTLEYAVRMWEVYTVAALQQTYDAKMKLVVLRYELLVQQPQTAVPALIEGLRNAGVPTGCDLHFAGSSCANSEARLAEALSKFASRGRILLEGAAEPDADAALRKFSGPAALHAALLRGTIFEGPRPTISRDTAEFFVACSPGRRLEEC